MFRKPKRKVKDTLRTRKTEDEDDDDNNKKAEASAQSNAGEEEDEDDESSTSELIREARKRVKKTIGTASTTTSTIGNDNGGKAKIMHSYATSSTRSMSHAERATSTAQHLPEKLLGSGVATAAGPKDDNDGVDNARDNKAQRGEDGIFRDQTRNKFWAGPIRAAANVRVTARFDYQPDICKDYKDTGFCGFGDTCIYLHDRGDTLAGWQIDQQWELEQKRKKDAQEKEMQNFLDAKSGNNSGGGGGDGITIEGGGSDDGLPFACFLCREYFKDPVVTTCQHYFCQDCIMDHVRNSNGSGSNSNTDNTSAAFCPICNKDTHGVFHQPTKLLAKKRKALGSSAAAKAENSWEEFYKLYSTSA